MAIFVDKDVKHEIELAEKKSETHDVRHFRFLLPRAEAISGIFPGKHVRITADVDGKTLSRFYSPISEPEAIGYFELVLKIYPVSEQDPSLGSFTRYLDSLTIGEKLRMSGPFGMLAYQGGGRFLWNNGRLKQYSKIGMIAGGTGITPMVQLIRSITRNKSDPTQVSLLFTNKTEGDVVFREELEQYAREEKESGRFRLLLTLTRVHEENRQEWPHSLGRINTDMAKSVLPAIDPESEDVLVLICGRKEMNQTAKAFCEELGYKDIHVY